MTVIVTCIYNNLHGTQFGGRNRRDRYRRSLRVIARTEVPVICFTSSSEIDELEQEFIDVRNVEFRVKDLDTLPFHRRVQDIKSGIDVSADLFLIMRSFEVMWGKLYMLDEVISERPDASDVYWVDAGLSHRDVISSKYSRDEDIEKDHSELTFGVFTPRLIAALKEFLDGKVLVIGSAGPNNPPIPAKYNKNKYTSDMGLVGGILGGDVDKMKKIVKSFIAKMDAVLKDGKLYSEESILTAVYIDNPELFKFVEFTTWYHEGWDDRFNPELKNFSNVFDDILEMDRLEEGVVVSTLAVGEAYREISKKFIRTFLANTVDFELVVLTDDPSYYTGMELEGRVSFVAVETSYSEEFQYNLKEVAIRRSSEIHPYHDTVAYFDCDCEWVSPVTFKDFEGIKPGINVADNVVNFIGNPAIRHVVDSVRKIEETTFHEFREMAIIFKLDDKFRHQRFLYEWERIADIINEKGMTHSGECFVIGLAAGRAGLPIHRIGKDTHPQLVRAILTPVAGEMCESIL